jgi:hypothetical protein
LGYRTDLEDGGIQAFEVPGLASRRYRWTASWEINAYLTEQYLLEKHWEENANVSFPMFDGWATRWNALAVGTGNGATVTFDLPGKDIDPADLAVALDAVPTGSYTFSQGTGANGADRVTFSVAPGVGVAITCSWLRGRRRFPKVWYVGSPSADNNEADLWQWSIELVEDPS